MTEQVSDRGKQKFIRSVLSRKACWNHRAYSVASLLHFSLAGKRGCTIRLYLRHSPHFNTISDTPTKASRCKILLFFYLPRLVQ
jgi:hypothetical protein